MLLRIPRLALFLVALAAPVAVAEDAAFLDEGQLLVVLPGEGTALRIDDCVRQALTGNEALRQDREGLAEMRAQRTQAIATAMPRFDLSGSWTRGRDPSFALDAFFADGAGFPSFGPGDIPAQTFWRSSLDASWELQPTRVLYAVRSADRAFDRQENLVRGQEQEVVGGVLEAYHRVILAREQMTAIEAELEARREFLDISRRRFLLELDAPLDTLQAAVSLENLSPTLRRAALNLRNAGIDLNVAMGRDALTPLSIVATFEVEREQISLEAALQHANARPDVRYREADAAFLRGRRAVQKAINHPSLSFDGSYGYVGRTADTVFDDGHDLWSATVALKIPLWDGMTARGQVKELDATIRRAEYAQSEVMNRARAEILSAHEELAVARDNMQAAALNLTRASDAHDQMQLRYELGKASYLEVLNAQAERFTARSNWVEARYQVLVSSSALKRAMGVSPSNSFASILSTGSTVEAQ